MNDGIDPEFCSLTYTSVDDMALIVSRLGKGTLMAKIDIEAAHRLLPVHRHDRLLQGVQWNGKVFVDPVLRNKGRHRSCLVCVAHVATINCFYAVLGGPARLLLVCPGC